MDIGICKWYRNAAAPVIFMIDDLANVWIDTNGNRKMDPGEDWGYAKNQQNSSYRYLADNFISKYPDIKITFFIPVGVRAGALKNSEIFSVSESIDSDRETIEFFRGIDTNPRCEIAYHGTTHGKVDETTGAFIQEWDTFQSLEQAIEVIQQGKETFKKVFGRYPEGGKYCGYEKGRYGDESIDSTGFTWWCRHWNRGLAAKKQKTNGDRPETDFDINYFGANEVVDIPSTISGGMFNGILNCKRKSLKGIIKTVLKPYLFRRQYNLLKYLIDNNLVISIQEHMAPSRFNGMRQTPNIFDDAESLRIILNYLRDKNVWYCTCTELAKYVSNRDNVQISSTGQNAFEINHILDKIYNDTKLTLKVGKEIKHIVLPDKHMAKVNNGIVDIDILKGEYTFELF
jgi:hypothetical protein